MCLYNFFTTKTKHRTFFACVLYILHLSVFIPKFSYSSALYLMCHQIFFILSLSVSLCSFADGPQRRRARRDLYVVFSPHSRLFLHTYGDMTMIIFHQQTKKLFYLLTLSLSCWASSASSSLSMYYNFKVAGWTPLQSLETIKINKIAFSRGDKCVWCYFIYTLWIGMWWHWWCKKKSLVIKIDFKIHSFKKRSCSMLFVSDLIWKPL